VDKINSFSDVTGIRSHLAGDSTVILEHNDAGDISLKQFNLPNGVGLSVNQLNQDGDRLLATSKTLSGGDSLVAGGHVQIKSTSDFSASYDGNSQNSENAAFEMGFADKKFDLANDFTDINFYANHQLDGGYADAKHLNAVASSSKYSLDLVDSAFGTLGSDFRPKTSEDFSSSKIARGLVSDLRNSATSTVFHGDEFILANGFPLDGSNIDFTLGDQKYVVTLNITDTFEIRANDVKIGNEVFSLTEGLAELAARSTFSISGPEDDRLSAQFEATANGVRLNVAANSGVVSGHSLLVSSTNSDAEKTNFHVSNTSTTELFSNNFVQTAGTNADIGSVIIDKTEYVIAFNTTTNAFSTTPGLPAAVTLSSVTNPLDTTKIQLKVSVTANSDSESIRLKANANSAAYGISTVSAQLLVTEEGLRIFNVGDQRVKSSVAVNSLASEVLSISGLQGEDLIFVANGARNPSAIGKVATTTEKAAREYSLVVNETDPSNIDIYDFSTGHIVGSRSIANDNSAVFQGLSIDFKGTTTGGDRYNVLISGANADDASNLNNMLETSFLNKETGVGGYSELFGKIVSNTGSEIQANQQTLETTEAAYQLALDNKSEFTGVDLDTEAARLMEQQQAYQALARVLSTARELLDTLLRSM
jgi:flagellar hook-associated protein 1 FlgK